MSAAPSITLLPREALVMAKDLPRRPERDPDAPVTKVSATDRVKAKTDKLDPRFEAARQRIAREEERRARAEAARRARRGQEPTDEAAGDDPDAEHDVDTPEQPRKGFSFNQTAERPGADEPNSRRNDGTSTKDAR